jgi:hypothetical protein
MYRNAPVIVEFTRRTVVKIDELNIRASQWQLFTTRLGAEAAADAINKTIIETANEGGSKAQVRSAGSDALHRYAGRFGGGDPEPYRVLTRLLDRLYGADEDPTH